MPWIPAGSTNATTGEPGPPPMDPSTASRSRYPLTFGGGGGAVVRGQDKQWPLPFFSGFARHERAHDLPTTHTAASSSHHPPSHPRGLHKPSCRSAAEHEGGRGGRFTHAPSHAHTRTPRPDVMCGGDMCDGDLGGAPMVVQLSCRRKYDTRTYIRHTHTHTLR